MVGGDNEGEGGGIGRKVRGRGTRNWEEDLERRREGGRKERDGKDVG
jgi:hypothetical protein